MFCIGLKLIDVEGVGEAGDSGLRACRPPLSTWSKGEKSRREFTTEGTEYTESRSNPRGRGPFDRTQGKLAAPLHNFAIGDLEGVGGCGIVVGVGVGGLGGIRLRRRPPRRVEWRAR